MKKDSFLKISIENDSESSTLNSFRQNLIQAQEYIRNLQHSDRCEFRTDDIGYLDVIVLAYYNADKDDVSFDLIIDMGNRLTDCLTFKDEEDLWHSTRQLEEKLFGLVCKYYINYFEQKNKYIKDIRNKVKKITKGETAKQNWRYYADLSIQISCEFVSCYVCLDDKLAIQYDKILEKLELWLNSNLSEDDIEAYHQYLHNYYTKDN